MDLYTPYELPYLVLYQPAPLFSAGGDLSVRGNFKDAVTDPALREAQWIMALFCELAFTGALCGDQVVPSDSTILDFTHPAAAGDSIEWTLTGCRTDERALIVLAQLFLLVHERQEVERLVFSRPGQEKNLLKLQTDEFLSNPYPPRTRDIGFLVDVDDEIPGNFGIVISFKNKLIPQQQEVVGEQIMSWATACATGAYPVAPVFPSECTLFPTEEITFIGNEAELGITRFRAHPGAIDGLINLCAAMSRKVSPIDAVSID
jgi:hypothetical protein